MGHGFGPQGGEEEGIPVHDAPCVGSSQALRCTTGVGLVESVETSACFLFKYLPFDQATGIDHFIHPERLCDVTSPWRQNSENDAEIRFFSIASPTRPESQNGSHNHESDSSRYPPIRLLSIDDFEFLGVAGCKRFGEKGLSPFSRKSVKRNEETVVAGVFRVDPFTCVIIHRTIRGCPAGIPSRRFRVDVHPI